MSKTTINTVIATTIFFTIVCILGEYILFAFATFHFVLVDRILFSLEFRPALKNEIDLIQYNTWIDLKIVVSEVHADIFSSRDEIEKIKLLDKEFLF